MKKAKLIIMTAALLAVPGLATAASVQIDLDFYTANLSPGDSVTFSGTISNLESSSMYLNGCSVNLTGISITGDCIDFLINAPLSLDPLQSGIPTFLMFAISANFPYLDSAGPQNGSFDILGGEGPSDLNLLGTANFSVDVQTPEPSGALLVVPTGIVLMITFRRKLAVQSGRFRRTIFGQCQGRPIQK